jgi:hypothetical protein
LRSIGDGDIGTVDRMRAPGTERRIRSAGRVGTSVSFAYAGGVYRGTGRDRCTGLASFRYRGASGFARSDLPSQVR